MRHGRAKCGLQRDTHGDSRWRDDPILTNRDGRAGSAISGDYRDSAPNEYSCRGSFGEPDTTTAADADAGANSDTAAIAASR